MPTTTLTAPVITPMIPFTTSQADLNTITISEIVPCSTGAIVVDSIPTTSPTTPMTSHTTWARSDNTTPI